MSEKKRVIFYIDGFNFYFGIKSKWKRKYYWLDIVKFCEQFLKSDQELVSVYYCSAPQIGSSRGRQSDFFSANRSNKKFKLLLGRYKNRQINNPSGGIINVPEEKKTDVNIVVQMARDVVFKKCDISILVSGDTDTVPVFELIREIDPEHKIFTYFPPNRFNNELREESDAILKLGHFESKFKKSLFPDTVKLTNGSSVDIPSLWKK